MSIYSGFVYIWYDRKRKWFCIGSHFGTLDDGYTSSTGFMNSAFKKRPDDFKRKVLEFYYGTEHKELFLLEQKWLDMIKNEELCFGENRKNNTTKYYNVKKNASGLSGAVASELKKAFWNSEAGAERKSVMSEEMRGNTLGTYRKGIPCSEETKKNISAGNKGKTRNKEQLERQSEITKNLWQDPDYLEKMMNRKRPDPEKIRLAQTGKKRTEETRNNISQALMGKPKTDEHKENLKKAAKTRKSFTCPHCGFQGRGGHRYHFNNCKQKPEE